MNRLVATLGTTWHVLPELFAYTNPDAVPLYKNASAAPAIHREREQYGLQPVSSIWVITTASGIEQWERLVQWSESLPARVDLCGWHVEGVNELFTPDENRAMADLTYRVALHARSQADRDGTALYFALAGGRKTMSAELQQAAHLFGSDALLHVVDRFGKEERERFNSLSPRDLTQPLPKDLADSIRPLVTAGKLPGNEALRSEAQAQGSITAEGYPLPDAQAHEGGSIQTVPSQVNLYEAVQDLQQRAEALLANYRLQVSAEEPLGNFRALYGLPQHAVESLRQWRLGCDRTRRGEELDWLRLLPKAELHCHLGGILDTPAMIRVAGSLSVELAVADRRNQEFADWRRHVETAVKTDDRDALWRLLPSGGLTDRELRQRFSVAQPLAVAGLLCAFKDAPELLDSLLFGVYRDPSNYTAIGIENYELLGNLQGSGLLQTENTLRAAMAELERQCHQEQISYLELRCSPLNYRDGGLSADDVVRVLVEESERIESCDIRLMFIASRHREPAQTEEHIQLALHWLDEDERFRRRFVGFDLAGAEHAMRPADLREKFRRLHERVVRLTIHAGEGEPAENIWEAVYELSADRIGHGLTLSDYPNLIERFRDRRIALEMCPSSNRQIRGYYHRHYSAHARREYPLHSYLDQGLRVTLNTDNPGISRTSLSEEYLAAAEMTPGGLSAWQILQIVRNGYQAAFCNQKDRRQLLIDAEKEILNVIQRGGAS